MRKTSGRVFRVSGIAGLAACCGAVYADPEIFHDDGIRPRFSRPLARQIAKDIFDIPRVTHAAGDGKPETGEHPVVLLQL